MKKILFPLMFILLGCAGTFLSKEPDIAAPALRLTEYQIYFTGLYMRKQITWYGELDRNWVTFHRIDPLYNLFFKEMQTFLKTGGAGLDYLHETKTAGIKDYANKKYILQEKGILLTRDIDFYQLAQQLKAPANTLFLSMEISFAIHQRGVDDSIMLTESCPVLKNTNGTTVFKKQYAASRKLTREEYMTLISYQKRNKENIAKTTHILLAEGFVTLSRQMLADLKSLR